MANRLTKFIEDFTQFRIKNAPSDRADMSISEKNDELVNRMTSSDSPISSLSQLSEFRTIAEDRETQYNTYDEMATDSVIAAALEIYADDATSYNEKGQIIWVESDIPEIADAGNRLLDKFEIPERAWKHIYQACKYGDYYLKLYRDDENLDPDKAKSDIITRGSVKVINDEVVENGDRLVYPYEDYVEDVYDPATVFDLRKRGKTAGFIEVSKDVKENNIFTSNNVSRTYSLRDVNVYRPDRLVHIMISENLTRNPETITIDLGQDTSATYEVARGKSILYDVYPIQRELQLLEDSLILSRLTRSSLIRLLEIEVGDMPKKEVNNYLRRIKNLIEQHISMDKNTGSYKSYNAPGPIDNVIYIPVQNGKGHININNLGGDVNVRDIADIDYFNNKRSGALKIPRSFLGDSGEGSQLDNGGTLTQLSMRYARTIKRIQTAYIRAITTLLNLFFIDKKLDYVNKFQVRMTSPSTQEDISRNDLINGNIDLISSIMSLTESLQGETQKEILTKLVSEILKMPDLAEIIEKDQTPDEEVMVDGEMSSGGSDLDIDIGDVGPEPTTGDGDSIDASDVFGDSSESPEGGFTDAEYSSFEDEL